MNLFENLQLMNEMAMTRSDAIEICMSLGEKFIDHFKKIHLKGKDDINFSHHCQELQSWYDKINRIILKTNNRELSKIQKIDWFFTCGSSLEYLFNNEQMENKYEEFIMKLLSSNTLIKDILEEIL